MNYYNNEYNQDTYQRRATAPSPFSPYYSNCPPSDIKPRKNWTDINRENLIKSCTTKLNIFRSDCGFNVGVYNFENKIITSNNDFKAIVGLCVENRQNLPVICFQGSDILLITVPEAIDKYFNLKKATKFQVESTCSGKKVFTFVYALKVPVRLTKDVEMFRSGVLSSLQATFSSIYVIDLFLRYTPVSPIKIKNTLELDEELLDALLEVAKQVESFNKTLMARLDHYELIEEPNLNMYKIGKSIQKNLSINEPITDKLLSRLSPEKLEAINKNFVTYKGLGMLSLDERRILEAVLVLVSNSQIVYATECPTSAQNFHIEKKIFLGKIIVNKHLKAASKAEKLMKSLSQRTFLIVTQVNYADFKTCIVTNLFRFSIKDDSYVFTIPPCVFKEILALKGSAFFVERERGFYDSCKTKTGLSVYNFLDYLDYLRYQPNSDDTGVPMKANLKNLLIKMGLYKYKNQGYKYIYEKFQAALKIAIELKFIEGFSLTYKEFQEKLKDTGSLGIRVLKPPENRILNKKGSTKNKKESKNGSNN